jgi:hypothetical protein
MCLILVAPFVNFLESDAKNGIDVQVKTAMAWAKAGRANATITEHNLLQIQTIHHQVDLGMHYIAVSRTEFQLSGRTVVGI